MRVVCVLCVCVCRCVCCTVPAIGAVVRCAAALVEVA